MQIVPVIDLKRGKVVRGIGGRRDEYRPIVSSLTAGSDPGAIASALVAQFAPTTIYVADLDAIETGEADIACWRAIAATGAKLWIDAGIGNLHRARYVVETLGRVGISGSPVIGLESLASIDVLDEIVLAVGPDALFGLDLRDGVPLARNSADQQLTPIDWAAAAVSAGFSRMLILDLADVGTGHGTRTLELCRRLKAEYPRLELISGGGVRHVGDLRDLAAAGCSAALVASALHDGRITREECDALAADR